MTDAAHIELSRQATTPLLGRASTAQAEVPLRDGLAAIRREPSSLRRWWPTLRLMSEHPRRKTFDVRWPFGAALASALLGWFVLPRLAYEFIALAGTLIVFGGLALASDYRGAVDRYLQATRVRPRRMDPPRWARLNGAWLALIGLGWLVGSASMLALGETPH